MTFQFQRWCLVWRGPRGRLQAVLGLPLPQPLDPAPETRVDSMFYTEPGWDSSFQSTHHSDDRA